MNINYEQKLKDSLEISAGMDGRQIAFCVVQYKVAAARTTPEKAFAAVMESYSNETIEQALQRITENRLAVDKNSQLEKLRSNVHKFEHNVNDVLQAEIVLTETEFNNLPEHVKKDYRRAESIRKAGVEVKIPNSLKPKYESAATFKEGSLEITVEN